ncbi:MAG: hypothetical protein K5697_09080 [Lachnospiraceae bacterium]|nr:hypothetical protein [Lachnospiraceae bacterium]
MCKRYAGNKRIGKIVSSAVCITALLAVFSALLFLLAESGHVCDDDDCPVCACMQMCEEQLHRLAGSLPEASLCFVMFFCALIFVALFQLFLTRDTPVLRKVRLNN